MEYDWLLFNIASDVIPSDVANSFISKLTILECNEDKISQADFLQHERSLVCFESSYYITLIIMVSWALSFHHQSSSPIDCVSTDIKHVENSSLKKLVFRFVSS